LGFVVELLARPEMLRTLGDEWIDAASRVDPGAPVEADPLSDVTDGCTIILQCPAMNWFVVSDAVPEKMQPLHSGLNICSYLSCVAGWVIGKRRAENWYPQSRQIVLSTEKTPKPKHQFGDDSPAGLGAVVSSSSPSSGSHIVHGRAPGAPCAGSRVSLLCLPGLSSKEFRSGSCRGR